jgi:hypothetical protein
MVSSTIERVSVAAMVEVVTTALANARSQGEPWQAKAEEHLGALEVLFQAIAAERARAVRGLEEGRAAIEAIDERTTDALEAMASRIWKGLGSPALDHVYTLLFPDADRTEGKPERPEHLELLADLLESGVHARIDAGLAQRSAAELRGLAAQYRASVESVARLEKRRTLLDELERATARSGLVEVGNLRKRLREMGVDENTIFELAPGVHSVRVGPKESP